MIYVCSPNMTKIQQFLQFFHLLSLIFVSRWQHHHLIHQWKTQPLHMVFNWKTFDCTLHNCVKKKKNYVIIHLTLRLDLYLKEGLADTHFVSKIETSFWQIWQWKPNQVGHFSICFDLYPKPTKQCQNPKIRYDGKNIFFWRLFGNRVTQEDKKAYIKNKFSCH